MKIIAIDPGGVTGWASFTIPMSAAGQVVWDPDYRKHFSNYGQLGPGDHHFGLYAMLNKHKPDVIVCERFENRNNEFAETISLEYIGVVKAYSQATTTTLVMQGASEALRFVDYSKLDKYGIALKPYKPWKDANAARKHLLFYLLFGTVYKDISNRLLQVMKPEKSPAQSPNR